MRRYDNQFKLSVLDYVHKHQELTVYECSRVFGIGYSTLNKWLRIENLNQIHADDTLKKSDHESIDNHKEVVRLQQELHEARKTLKVLKNAFELLGK